MGADRKLALITGAAGLVGSRIAQRFLLENMSARALDQRPVDVAGLESWVGNVTDPGAVQRATARAALVVHCAAVISGTPEETMRVNAEGTRLLLEAAMQAGCERFLYMSTAAVYAFDDRAVVDESTPFLQEGPAFHLSRVRAEQAVWAASARGLAVTVFRPYFILGAHPTSTWSALLAQRIVKGEFVLGGGWAWTPCPPVRRSCPGAGASAERRRSENWATCHVFRMKRRCRKPSATWLKPG
jgi:nucleoside-diphosphate-sugar epimerase